MQKIWFTADTHFEHFNVLLHHPERAKAAGISEEELLMEDTTVATTKYNEWLIKKWNETVDRNDIVYILGDLCLADRETTEKIIRRLKGRKFLINGNHDKSCKGLERYFEWKGTMKEAKFRHEQFPFIENGETFCIEMQHMPLMAWNRRPRGTVHLHGHVHGVLDDINLKEGELRVDVGLDGKLANYGLVSLEDIYKYFRKIVTGAGYSTFQEYIDYLMFKQGYRI